MLYKRTVEVQWPDVENQEATTKKNSHTRTLKGTGMRRKVDRGTQRSQSCEL